MADNSIASATGDEDELKLHTDEEETLIMKQQEVPKEETVAEASEIVKLQSDDLKKEENINEENIKEASALVDMPTTSETLLHSNRVRRYLNNGGNFITGVDISSAVRE